MRFLKALTFFTALSVSIGTQAADLTFHRIVSLSPTITELVFDFGFGEKLVGTTEFSDYPEAAKKIPRIGAYSSPLIERIVALKPDLVLVSEEGLDNVTAPLLAANIKVEKLKMKTLSDFEVAVEKLGVLFNAKPQAEALNKKWFEDWSLVTSFQKSQTTIIQVDHDPLVIAGGGTFLSDVAAKCGLTNLFQSLSGYPRPNAEVLIQKQSQTVLVTVHNGLKKEVRREIENFWNNPKLSNHPKLYFVNPDEFSRLSPRLPNATLALCKRLQNP